RARVSDRSEGRGLEGARGLRAALPAQLLPAAAARRSQEDLVRALVDRALVEDVRLRGHARVVGAGLRVLDGRGAARARGLEDGRRRGRRVVPARLLRAL